MATQEFTVSNRIYCNECIYLLSGHCTYRHVTPCTSLDACPYELDEMIEYATQVNDLYPEGIAPDALALCYSAYYEPVTGTMAFYTFFMPSWWIDRKITRRRLN